MVRFEKYQLPHLKPIQDELFLNRFTQVDHASSEENESFIARRQRQHPLGNFGIRIDWDQDYFTFNTGGLITRRFLWQNLIQFHAQNEDLSPYTMSFNHWNNIVQFSPLQDYSLVKKIQLTAAKLQTELLMEIRKNRKKIAYYVRQQLIQNQCQKYEPIGIAYWINDSCSEVQEKFRQNESIQVLRLSSKETTLSTFQRGFWRKPSISVHLFYEMKCLKAEEQKQNDFIPLICLIIDIESSDYVWNVEFSKILQKKFMLLFKIISKEAQTLKASISEYFPSHFWENGVELIQSSMDGQALIDPFRPWSIKTPTLKDSMLENPLKHSS